MTVRDQSQHVDQNDSSARAARTDHASLEHEDAYELQDHEFILEPDETLAAPHAHAQSTTPVLPPRLPPLPRWAAASRALLNGFLGTADDDALSTLEVAPALAALSPAVELDSERGARKKLARLLVLMQAREVYVHEVERALAAANGRARGQTFRIAELSLELRAARWQLDRARAAAQPFAQFSAHHELNPDINQDVNSSVYQPSSVLAEALRDETGSGVVAIARANERSREVVEIIEVVEPAELAAAPSTIEPPTIANSTRGRAADDLTQISGIGPRFAARLHALGIYSYAQLASWHAADIKHMAERLGIGKQRIAHEGWVKQARALAKPKARARTRSKRKAS
jgi:predicted flap endonuclease-1-like 5' DNA nuclease